VVVNTCQVGHPQHDRKVVSTILGDMTIYDWEKYANTTGYCTGDDAVSQTLEKTQSWDIEEFNRMKQILEAGDRSNLFIDCGCHLGWFSKLAESLGYPIIAYDGDKENLELLKLNVPSARSKLIWFDENIKPRKWCKGCSRFKGIECMKLDLEGNEQWGIEYYRQAFEQKAVKNVIMEVSPVFNSSYEALLNRLRAWGYEAFELNGTPFSYTYDFHQKDLWLHL
jgi:hypothetical protein